MSGPHFDLATVVATRESPILAHPRRFQRKGAGKETGSKEGAAAIPHPAAVHIFACAAVPRTQIGYGGVQVSIEELIANKFIEKGNNQ